MRDEVGWIFTCGLLFKEQQESGEVNEFPGVIAVIDDPVGFEKINKC